MTQNRTYKRIYTCENCGKLFFTGGPLSRREKVYQEYRTHSTRCQRSNSEKRAKGAY